METSLIRQEFVKRKYLLDALEVYIETNFAPAAKEKLKRGTVQKEIADLFNLTSNNVFCELVNIIMENKGYMCRTIRGNQYYKGVKRV